jgi:thiamine-monophosphate kinase
MWNVKCAFLPSAAEILNSSSELIVVPTLEEVFYVLESGDLNRSIQDVARYVFMKKKSEKPLGEFDLIRKLTQSLPLEWPDMLCGIGDDCAVFRGVNDRNWIVTMDTLVEKIHFRREWTDMISLGRKALAVNLSDIAAMGGMPRFYLISLSVPENYSQQELMQLYKGMKQRADDVGMLLIGGDTTASPDSLSISITAIGEVEGERFLRRDGAYAGDTIFVTGHLGSSALGLELLRQNRTDGHAIGFMKQHRDPEPRLIASRMIVGEVMATAMIDISDGLLADLGHIANASDLGFEVESSRLPFTHHYQQTAQGLGVDPLQLALYGGEDYELLFTVAQDRLASFEHWITKAKLECQVTPIGHMIASKKRRVVLGDAGDVLPFEVQGYDHFVRRSSIDHE